MNLVDKLANQFLKKNKKWKRWQRGVSVLAAVVVFATTYALILPAITLEKDTAAAQDGIELSVDGNIVYDSKEEQQNGNNEEEEPENNDSDTEDTDLATTDAASTDSATTDTTSTETVAADSTSAETPTADDNTVDETDPEESGEASTKEIAEPIVLITEPTKLMFEGKDYFVYADFDAAAELPEGVELCVKEITKEDDPEEYESYYEKSLRELHDKYDENTMLSFARFYDISFVYQEAEVEPSGNVKVRIEYKEIVEVTDETTIDALHFDKADEEKTEIIETEIDSEKNGADEAVKAVEFESARFSVYGIVGTETIETTFLTADGETYKITVTYGPEAEIPRGASLSVREITGDELAEIETLTEDAREENLNVALSRTFDIKILDAEGKEIQLADNAKVKVSFELEYVEDQNLDTQIYHLHEENGAFDAEALEVETIDGSAVVGTDGFSYFHVEFTYEEKTYQIGGQVKGRNVAGIRNAVGLTGQITDARVSNTAAINLYKDGNNWLIDTLEPFEGEEHLYITIRGIEYDIKLTSTVDLPEAYSGGTKNGVRQYGDNNTFLHQCDLATIFILEENMKNPDVWYDSAFSLSTRPDNEGNSRKRIVYTGSLPAGDKTTFAGNCCTLTYRDAAILSDGTLGDIQLTFSDVSFYTQPGTETNPTYSADENNVVEFDNSAYYLPRVESGNEGANLAVGLEVKVTTKILNKDGSVAQGSYYYGMKDIDIARDPIQSSGKVFDAENHYYFSEQVEIVSGAQSVAYIPEVGSTYGRYLCGIGNNTGDDANGLIFTPTLGTPDPGEYGSGFATLADAQGFEIIVRSAAINGAVHTTVSPGSIGGLYAKKTVINGTQWDYARNWEIELEIDGTTFVDDQMKHGDEPVFVGAFIRDYEFTAEETLPDDWDDYTTTWRVVNGVSGETAASGDGPNASGTLLPKTIMEFENERIWIDPLLTIKKIVLNQEDEQELQRDWVFTLTLTDGPNDEPLTGLEAPAGAQNWSEKTEIVDDQEVGTGIYTFTLKHGEQLELKLPKGCKYSVAETPVEHYYTTCDDPSGILKEYKVVTFTNEYGYHLTVNKVWDSGDFVTEHGDIQIALFKDVEGTLTYVEGSVRTIEAPETSVVYSNIPSIDDVIVREVTVTTEGETVTVTPIRPNGVIAVNGETTIRSSNATDTYVVTYEQGALDSETGYRTDTITNTMPQLTVNKLDMEGSPLADAVFTLVDENGDPVPGYESITSTDEDGGNLLDQIYLSNGTYYLIETDAPDGFNLLKYKVKLTVTDQSVVITAMTDPASTINISDQTPDNNLLYTFNVNNSSGFELPSTGGTGTLLYALCGLVLIITSALMYCFMRSRKII